MLFKMYVRMSLREILALSQPPVETHGRVSENHFPR